MNGNIFPVREINNFILGEKSKLSGLGNLDSTWVCPSCQVENNLPDLKTICKGCSLTSLKPREVLKTIPDIDQISVIRSVDDKTLKLVEKSLKNAGYTQSDISILNSIQETLEVLRSFEENKKPTKKLPIDFHIISFDSFSEKLKLIEKGEKPFVDVFSLRSGWVKYDLPIWFDFIFSAKEIGYVDPELLGLIKKVRKSIVTNFDVESIITDLAHFSPRAGRILEDENVKNILKEKLESWKKI